MKRIVVLEDMVERVEWLLHVTKGTGVDVVWCQTVETFDAELKALLADELEAKLIILDHDLGPYSLSSEDENGRTGQHGADLIPDECQIPVIVWSINPQGGRQMHRSLLRRGVNSTLYPFLSDRWGLRELVCI